MDQSESGKIYFTEQTDRLGNSTERVLSVTLFLVAINGIFGELGVANKLDAWAAKRGLIFSSSKTFTMTFRKKNKKKQ